MTKVRARLKDGKVVWNAPYEDRHRSRSVVNAKWNQKSQCWEAPATYRTVSRLADAFHVRLDPDLECQNLLSAARAAEKSGDLRSAVDLPDIPGSATTAWQHQRQAFWWAAVQNSAMLNMGMGTGKSKVVVDLIRYWDCNKVLILCPTSVLNVWPREFNTHSFERDRPHVAVVETKGTVARRIERLEKDFAAAKAAKQPFVVVINYEAAWRQAAASWFLNVVWDAVVCDESHRIKSPNSRASKFAYKVGRQSKRRLALTGTMLPHSPLDFYGQARFLDSGLFGTSFVKFRQNFAVMGGFENKQVIGFKMHDGDRYFDAAAAKEWNRVLEVSTIRITEDVLDLPEEHHVVRHCSLPPRARKSYERMHDDFVATVGDKVVSAANAGVKILRLQQITSGFLPDDDSDDLIMIHDAKRHSLKDIVADLPPDEPVVVFCRFKHDLATVKSVAEECEKTYAELSGSSREALDDRAELRDGVQVAGVQIQAGGVGIDLTKARYAVYYSVGYALGDFLQSEKRLHRPGQTRPVVYYHLVAENTVDETIAKALRARRDVVDAVLAEAVAAPGGA